MEFKIPQVAAAILTKLSKAGFEAYAVGGCVRDMLLGKEPEDWDIAASATPEEIQKIFPQSFYENQFFTVTVLTESKDPRLKEIEVTTFRAEFEYGDRRRPGRVEYAKTIEEDLSRRDFTMNAVALALTSDNKQLTTDKKSQKSNVRCQMSVIDPFKGQKDLKAGLIRAVGNAEDRFQEDALRQMRAVRFTATLGFTIEKETREAIQKNAKLLKEISQERIRDELVKILMSQRAMEGIEALRELKLLQHILPEFEEGYGVSQNKHHCYTVWEHNLLSLQYAAKKNWDLTVRLAALLHDIAKPRVKKGEGPDATFHGHEVVGAKMALTILERLKFSKKDIAKITKLIRYHLFYYNVEEVTESSVRRLVRNVGKENAEALLKLRMADRIGSGVPKAEPYKLRHLQYVIEKVSQDPISTSMLEIDGTNIMEMGKLEPGPKIGQLLDILLGEVLEDPKKNTKEYLADKLKELLSLSDKDLEALAKKSRKEREHIEEKRDEMTKDKYWV